MISTEILLFVKSNSQQMLKMSSIYINTRITTFDHWLPHFSKVPGCYKSFEGHKMWVSELSISFQLKMNTLGF